LETAFRARAIELARARDPMPWGLALKQALKDESSKWQDDKDKLVKLGEKPAKGAGGRGGPGAGPGPGGDGRREVPRGGPGAGAGRPGGAGGDRGGDRGGGDRGGDRGAPGPRNNRDAHTGTEQNGKRICKAFNDQRGCKHPCEKGQVHVCDIRLQSGRVCGKSNHHRRNHDEGKDGKISRS
jgi:hypothetical protein